jgi:hypothetical protein
MKTKFLILLITIASGALAQTNNFSIKNGFKVVYSKTFETNLNKAEIIEQIAFTPYLHNIRLLTDSLVTAEIVDLTIPTLKYSSAKTHLAASFPISAAVAIKIKNGSYTVTIPFITSHQVNSYLTSQLSNGVLVEWDATINSLKFNNKSKNVNTRKLLNMVFIDLFTF